MCGGGGGGYVYACEGRSPFSYNLDNSGRCLGRCIHCRDVLLERFHCQPKLSLYNTSLL